MTSTILTVVDVLTCLFAGLWVAVLIAGVCCLVYQACPGTDGTACAKCGGRIGRRRIW